MLCTDCPKQVLFTFGSVRSIIMEICLSSVRSDLGLFFINRSLLKDS